jgi:hypothetical protein
METGIACDRCRLDRKNVRYASSKNEGFFHLPTEKRMILTEQEFSKPR